MNLQEYLKENDISITQFAQSLDYTRTHISNVVNGKQKPSPKLKRMIENITRGIVK